MFALCEILRDFLKTSVKHHLLSLPLIVIVRVVAERWWRKSGFNDDELSINPI